MHKGLLAALAAAAILSSGSFGNRAEAMTLAKPSTLDVVNARAAIVLKVRVVCGTNGCAPVQTGRPRKRTHP